MKNLHLAATQPDERVSGTYKRATSSTLEAKAALVRAFAAQVKDGDFSPKIIADKLENLACGLDGDAGAVLALEAQVRCG